MESSKMTLGRLILTVKSLIFIVAVGRYLSRSLFGKILGGFEDIDILTQESSPNLIDFSYD